MKKEQKDKLKKFESNLGYTFKDIELLRRALTHKSYANEMKLGSGEDNERYEFLGDAVLELVISHLIMENFPNYPEGKLSKIRAAIVNESQLAEIAKKIDLGDFLLLGRGEVQTGGREKPSLLSDAFEALLGAMYIDQGYKKTFPIIANFYEDIISHVGEVGYVKDYKTRLQEKIQGAYKTIPRYELVRTTGPDHSKVFEINLYIKGSLFSEGKGQNKKSAEQNAAKIALKRIQSEGLREIS